MQEIPLSERILFGEGYVLIIILGRGSLGPLCAYLDIIGLNPIKGIPVFPVRQEDVLWETVESANIKGDRISIRHAFLL